MILNGRLKRTGSVEAVGRAGEVERSKGWTRKRSGEEGELLLCRHGEPNHSK